MNFPLVTFYLNIFKEYTPEVDFSLDTFISTFSDNSKIMEHLREQVMINQFVQVIKYVLITVQNS